MQQSIRLSANFAKPQLYVNVLAKIRADARRRFGFTIIKYPTTRLLTLKPVLNKLQETGLILGVVFNRRSSGFTFLNIKHACIGTYPIRRAEIVMRSNVKYNRVISFKQLRRLSLWGQGADLLISTSHGVVTANYCIMHRLGGRILGSVRG